MTTDLSKGEIKNIIAEKMTKIKPAFVKKVTWPNYIDHLRLTAQSEVLVATQKPGSIQR
jgi:hypothetical protein